MNELLRYPEARWRKWMFKMPLVLWRMGLGVVMGRYLVVITTTGRKTGLARRTLTEWHPYRDSILVPVAFGEKAQWYRNIEANPVVTIQTHRGIKRVIARTITDDAEILAAVKILKKRNPVMTDWYLHSVGINDSGNDREILAAKDRLYFLTFEPTINAAPPPLRADLWWVMPSALILGFLSWRVITTR